MALSNDEIETLLRAIALTRERELDCDQCLSRLAEVAESELAGRTVSEALEAVEHHLAICPECREEYEALQRALTDLDA